MPDTPSAAHCAQPTAAPATNGALSHIRVLDLSRVLAGPWCTQILADMGADVIKIEKPGEGDDTRRWGPPFLNDDQGERTDQASYYSACNRNKRSATIDIATPQGQALIRQMALQSDVLVENYKMTMTMPPSSPCPQAFGEWRFACRTRIAFAASCMS